MKVAVYATNDDGEYYETDDTKNITATTAGEVLSELMSIFFGALGSYEEPDYDAAVELLMSNGLMVEVTEEYDDE